MCRPSTFVFTTLLFILSFTAALAESANVRDFRARHAWRKRAPLDVIPTNQLLTSTSILPPIVTSSATGFSPPSTSLPSIPVSVPSPLSLSPPPIPTPSNLPTFNPTTISTSSDSSTPSPTSTITASAGTSTSATTASTSQAQVQITNQGTPLSYSSSSHPSSSQHSSSAASSTPGVASVGAATSIIQNTVTPGYSGLVTTAGYPSGTTISATPSSGSSSNSGFFSNTGAVAGTFTIAGLFGVAGIIGVGMMIVRRRVSRSYDDDMEYLEKKLDPAVGHSQDQDFVVGDIEDLSDLSHVSNTMEVTVPPAAHLHPQYNVYGQTTNGSDGHEGQDYYPQGAYPPQVYGIAYPSRESYAAADPYGGIDESSGMPNPFDNVATELPAASQHSNQQLRTPSPPLTTYLHRSIDSFYGSSATASHGHAM